MLDLKYRPRKFKDVLGNDGVKQLLTARIRHGTLGDQSMMLGGPKGCGKTTLARLIARSLLCSSITDGEPCGECPTCVAILDETHPDVEELDAASQGTVDKVRSMIRDIDYEVESSYRIYILDEAQRLSASAQDALLKAIENRSFIVILCTTEPHKIREPIRSRVEEYPIYPPDTDLLLERMLYVAHHENMEVEEEALRIIINIHQNCPRLCLLTLDSLASLGPVTKKATEQLFRFDSYANIVKLLASLNHDLSTALTLLEALNNKETPTWIRDTTVFAISSAARQSLGIKHKFPTQVDDLVANSQNLIRLAHRLGSIEKPLRTDLEVALLDHVVPHEPSVIRLPAQSTVETAQPDPIHIPPPEPEPAPELALEPEPKSPSEPAPVPNSQSIEIEGVKFSADENLTSLDGKIGNATVKEDTTDDAAPVKYDKNNVPITEKQFIDGFLASIKR